MSASIFDKLNLQPHERRFVVVGTVILLLLLNYLVIIPYFKEWSVVSSELEKVEERNRMFSAEIEKKSTYEKRISDLKKNEGANILDLAENERATYVMRVIQQKAEENQVNMPTLRQITSLARGFGAKTNQFFDEVSFSAEVNGEEKALVDFLEQLGRSEAMIRVRGMNNLGLDPTQHRLKTTLTLVASFQRKQPVAAPKTAAPTNKPPAKVVQSRGPTNTPIANPAAAIPAPASAAAKTNKNLRSK